MTAHVDEPTRRELILFVVGEVTQVRSREIDEHLVGCSRCHDEVDAIRSMSAALSAPADEFAGTDLVGDVLLAVEKTGSLGTMPRPRTRLIAVSGLSVLAAAILAVVVVRPWFEEQRDGDSAFRAKAASLSDSADKWVGLKVFSTDRAEVTRRAESTVPAGLPLGFAYTNVGSAPFDYLMVFAVDDAGDVYWYYPAFVDSNADPMSVPIAHGAVDVSLPEQVEHSWKGSRVALYAVFTRRELVVSEVESLVREATRAGGGSFPPPERLPIADSGQHRVVLQVLP